MKNAIRNLMHAADIFYSSDSDSEVEGRNLLEKVEVAEIKGFLEMACAAYEDKSLAETCSQQVARSQLIKDLSNRTALIKLPKITTDTEVHVCLLRDGSLAFVFRGTEIHSKDLGSLLGDLVTDIMIFQAPVEHYNASQNVAYRAPPYIKAHRGFQYAFGDVTRTSRNNENIRLVADGLGAHAMNVKRVICIGHSLGGALATLCAHWCRYVAYPKAEIWCVTMGSPRVGNKAFAHDFNKNVVSKGRSYRVVNKGDIIPLYLRYDTVFSIQPTFKHVRDLIHLGEHPTSKKIEIFKRINGRLPRIYLPNPVDHSLTSYRESLKRALEHLCLSH